LDSFGCAFFKTPALCGEFPDGFSRSGSDGFKMPELENEQHEAFAWLVGHDVPLPEAYRTVGFRSEGYNSSNWNRLSRRPDVKKRIQEIRDQREKIAEAALLQPAEIIKTLADAGIGQITDFFAPDESGNLRIKDLRGIKSEAATAFVRLIRKAFGLPVGFDRVVPVRLITDRGPVDQDLRSRLESRVDRADVLELSGSGGVSADKQPLTLTGR
jgi:hypothetical protein